MSEPIRIILNESDWTHLTLGGELSQGEIRIIQSDIGYYRQIGLLKAYKEFASRRENRLGKVKEINKPYLG